MQKLGVFDSGIGGFNVVNKLKQTVSADIVFLADHKNLPYGDKSEEKMKEILVENIQWFSNKNIKQVLIACNTASTYIDFLRDKFPHMILDSILEITAQRLTDEQNLMIFGTLRTVASKLYDRHLNYKSEYLALSELATLVEQNDLEIIETYLKQQLSDEVIKGKVLLACTHYSIVKKMFEDILKVEILDSIPAVIDYYKDFKGENQLEVYTSGNVKTLSDQLNDIFDCKALAIPMKNQFKIVVVSDNHGRYSPLSQVLQDNPDAAAFIHCGDVELEPDLLKPFYVVTGNNDYYHSYPDNLLIDVGHIKLYVTHGHRHSSYNRINSLAKDGVSLNADIVCFGHEHIFQQHQFEDILIVNPGSLYYNRDNSQKCYAIINVNGEEISVKRVDI